MPEFVSVWEYRVRADAVGEFLQHYGPQGTWVQLFARAPGFLGTRLTRDAMDTLRFLTVDRWRSRDDYDAFRRDFAAEYEALDRDCERLTTSEVALFSGEEIAAPAFERRRGPYVVSTDPARLDLASVHEVLARSYWSPRIPLAVLRRGIAHSLAFGLYEGERTIGFARAVTDRASFAYLADVYVVEERRGQGLGTWLVESMLAHPELAGLRRFVLVTRDAHALYAKFGFAPLAAPDRYLEIVRPAAELYGG